MATLPCALGASLEGPSLSMGVVQVVRVCTVWHGSRGAMSALSLRRRKVGLPLVLWQDHGPNFKGLPKVSGVATNHWAFLRCDWSLVSS